MHACTWRYDIHFPNHKWHLDQFIPVYLLQQAIINKPMWKTSSFHALHHDHQVDNDDIIRWAMLRYFIHTPFLKTLINNSSSDIIVLVRYFAGVTSCKWHLWCITVMLRFLLNGEWWWWWWCCYFVESAYQLFAHSRRLWWITNKHHTQVEWVNKSSSYPISFVLDFILAHVWFFSCCSPIAIWLTKSVLFVVFKK